MIPRRHTPLPVLAAGCVLFLLWPGSPAAAPPHPDYDGRLQRWEVDSLAPEQPVERQAGLVGAATASGRAFTLHPRVLVLLVDFADRPANPALWSPEVYEQRLFSLDTQEFGSLRDYYRAASYGAMDVTGEVFGWFRMPQPYTFYVNGREGTCSTCYPNNARGLVADALQAAVDGGIVFSRFDNDGPDNQPGTADDDGLLDGLLVVFPGLGAERTFSAQDFRSHYWDVTANRFVGDTEVPDYALIAGDENIGVSVHEFGHILGGDDLYDLSGQTPGLGDYSVMARAMWFNNGRSPGGPDPFTRMQWGLLEPEVIRADEPGLTLPRILDAPAAFRLWTRGEPGDEFFLVENRNPTGIDRFLPGDGVLVYHIDRSVPRQQNAAHFRVSLVQADGLNSLHGGFPPNSGEPGDFLPGKLGVRTLSDHTVPDLHTHAGHPSQVALTVPGDPGPEMLVDVVVGVPLGGDPRPAVRVEPSEGLFAAGVSFGETRSLELVVQNRGTRLAPSRLLLSSADPRVRVLDPGPFDVARIPALGSVRVPGAVRFSLDTAPEDRRVLPVEAVLSGESGVYRSVARLPLESSVVLRESFETEGAGRVVSLNATPPAVWERSPRRATHGRWSWWTRGGSLGYPERVDEVLVLGPFPVNDAA